VNNHRSIDLKYHANPVPRFANEAQLAHMPLLAEAAMKDEHTIIEKWPYRLKLEPG
jgi:hypothetical protein